MAPGQDGRRRRGAQQEEPREADPEQSRGGECDFLPRSDRAPQLAVRASSHLDVKARLEIQISEIEVLGFGIALQQFRQPGDLRLRDRFLDHGVGQRLDFFPPGHAAPPGAALRSTQSKSAARIRRSSL